MIFNTQTSKQYMVIAVSEDGRRDVVASTYSKTAARLAALALYRQDLSKTYVVIS